MKLEDKTDVLIAEQSQLFVIHPEDINPFKQHSALGCAIQRAENVKQRALAGARWSYDRYNFSLRHFY